MLPTQQTHKFQQALGHLFYAIAAADKIVKPKEIDALRQLILTDWLPAENNVEGTFQIQIVFDRLTEQGIKAEDAMASFKFFTEEHEHLFTDEMRDRIWKTVNTIAEAVAGKNKSELVMLSKLDALFKSWE